MSKIFISYRRADSADAAGRLFDRLEDKFGRDALFMDIDSIPLGADFRTRIDEALDASAVALIVIGKSWIDATLDDGLHATKRRLDDPDDYVRLETQAALERGLPVIPVLVGGASMPEANDLPVVLRDLATRNAAELSAGPTFRSNLDRLIETLAKSVEPLARDTHDATSRGVELPIAFTALQEDPSLLCGRNIDAYTIKRVLATGGSGVAYLASNPRLGQQVCIKLSFPVLSDLTSIKRAIGRGIRGIVKLDHPHIARIYEFDALQLLDDHSFYVAMEYVDGLDLDKWSDTISKDPEGRKARLRVSCLLARCLADAHECKFADEAGFELVGVLHGDIKPGNILVRPNGEPAICDFMLIDIQRALDPAFVDQQTEGDNLTAAFGTPGFMAPEQELQGTVTAKTDIYGLGRTLITLFYGHLSLESIRHVVTSKTELDGLLARMIAHDPQERPDSMRTVTRELTLIASREGFSFPEVSEASVSPTHQQSWWRRILGR